SLLQVLGTARVPDGSVTPPLRDEGLVGDEDHGALLDRDRHPLRRRLRALLQVLPADQTASVKVLVYGLARSGRAAEERLLERGDEVVVVDRSLGNEDDLRLLDGIDVVVKSPGVRGEAPLVRAARGAGIPVWSEVE